MGPALDVLEAELLGAGKATEMVQKMRATDVLPSGGRTSSARPPGMRRDVRGHRERRGAG